MPHFSCSKLEILFYHFSFFSFLWLHYFQIYAIIAWTEKAYNRIYPPLIILFSPSSLLTCLCIHQSFKLKMADSKLLEAKGKRSSSGTACSKSLNDITWPFLTIPTQSCLCSHCGLAVSPPPRRTFPHAGESRCWAALSLHPPRLPSEQIVLSLSFRSSPIVNRLGWTLHGSHVHPWMNHWGRGTRVLWLARLSLRPLLKPRSLWVTVSDDPVWKQGGWAEKTTVANDLLPQRKFKIYEIWKLILLCKVILPNII